MNLYRGFVFLLAIASCGCASSPPRPPLPALSEEMLDGISYTLGSAKYPIRFRDLYDKLGGEKVMVWCCRFSSRERTTLQFAISAPDSGRGTYYVEFDFKPDIEEPSEELCLGARLAFESPYGTTFYAKLLGADRTKASPEKRPNQSPEPTVLSVTSCACAQLAPATIVAHL
jgi:hypothetical protein